jgi:hypothetical protein
MVSFLLSWYSYKLLAQPVNKGKYAIMATCCAWQLADRVMADLLLEVVWYWRRLENTCSHFIVNLDGKTKMPPCILLMIEACMVSESS